MTLPWTYYIALSGSGRQGYVFRKLHIEMISIANYANSMKPKTNYTMYNEYCEQMYM